MIAKHANFIYEAFQFSHYDDEFNSILISLFVALTRYIFYKCIYISIESMMVMKLLNFFLIEEFIQFISKRSIFLRIYIAKEII